MISKAALMLLLFYLIVVMFLTTLAKCFELPQGSHHFSKIDYYKFY